MKKTDYKKALDKVKCSDSFRKQLSEKLSEEPQASDEYADIITEVENVKPRKIGHSIAAIAACAAICVGVATVYKNASDSPDTYESGLSVSESQTDDTVPDIKAVIEQLYEYDITACLGRLARIHENGDNSAEASYGYADDNSTFKKLSDLTKETVLNYLSNTEWDKWRLKDNELTDEVKEQMCSNYIHLNFNVYEIYIFESSYVELRINDSAETSTSVFYDLPDNFQTYESYLRLYNGASPPLDNFYEADIKVEYNGELVTPTEEQKNQIRALLTKYDWVPDTSASVTMYPLYIQLTVGDKTSHLKLTGAIEYYENGYDEGAEGYQPPTQQYVLTLELVEQIKEIIEPSCNPIAMKELPNYEMKIRYGSGDYVNISSESNRERIIYALYDVEWERTDSQQIMPDADDSLILQLIENGEESYFFLNNNIEYRMGDIAQSYVLPDMLRNEVIAAYCSEISEPVFVSIAERAPTYLGKKLSESQALELQELFDKCNWVGTVVTDKSDITLNYDTCTTLQLGSGPIYVQLFDNGYVRCVSPVAAIDDTLFKQTEFATSAAKKIITDGFDYSAAAKEQINFLPISPLTSVYYESTTMVFVTDDSQYESASTAITMDNSQGSELWTILSEAEYEFAENTDFEYENFYQLSFSDYNYSNPITFNEDGYIHFITDDYNYAEFTVKMSEADTEALNSFLKALKESQ